MAKSFPNGSRWGAQEKAAFKVVVSLLTLFFLVFLALRVVKMAQGPEPPPIIQNRLTEAAHSMFKPGQVWAYKTRLGEEKSLLTVVKVDSDPRMGNIVSVYLDGLQLMDTSGNSTYRTVIPHMAFAENTLKESVTRLIKAGADLPNYEEGYQAWLSEFNSGGGSVFVVPVSKAIGTEEDLLNKSWAKRHP